MLGLLGVIAFLAILLFISRSLSPSVRIASGLVALVVVIAMIAVSIAYPPQPQAPTVSAQPDAAAAVPVQPTADDCALALASENASVAALNRDDYQTAYHYAQKGLAQNLGCSDDNDRLVNHAYLLSMRGLAEHHLSVGDSRTDLNQANALLVQCETAPGLYGTHTGAQCETQEQNNIQTTTGWEMENL